MAFERDSEREVDDKQVPQISVLHGAVMTVDGHAVPSARLRISSAASPTPIATAITDSNGEFNLKVQSGEYEVTASSTWLFTGGSISCASVPASVPSRCTPILNPALAFRAIHHHLVSSCAGYIVVTGKSVLYTPTTSGSKHRLQFVTANIQSAQLSGQSTLEFSYERKRLRFSIVSGPAPEHGKRPFPWDAEMLKKTITNFDSVMQTILRSGATN